MRKYRRELHANEIVLLACYIAAVHVEEAFHGRCHDHPNGGIWERGRPARITSRPRRAGNQSLSVYCATKSKSSRRL